ncbi:MAG: glycogen synthase GlgA [Myxococcales bacterium]|nr:MAG: glycogen synthase GlgA [Myxococcales bacterium]
MVSRPLRVLHIASECAPFAKSGGLGDVVGALPAAQRALGIDARVVMPLYRGIKWDALEKLPHTLVVPLGGRTVYGGVRRGRLENSEAPVYFLEHHHYFDRDGFYGDRHGEFGDNLERFAFLSRGAFELCRAEGFVPDVIHAHDWQAALAPVYVNSTMWGTEMHGCATVMTVHNLGYQGQFAPADLPVTGLGFEHLNDRELEHFGALNLLKGGLMHADRISTVSPSYAREIQQPENGAGLDGVIRSQRHRLAGILNGVDTSVWNPATDRYLPARFDMTHIGGKAACKALLQRELGLPERSDVPVFAVIARLTEQKGLDVLLSILPSILAWDIQLVVLGTGDGALERGFTAADRLRGDRIRALLQFNDGLAHRIEAGADFFVMPSRYEPCGMNQMYSMRYGTLPIVHATGGLADTVWNYDERTGDGTGFVLHELSPGSLHDTLAWALATYHQRPEHIGRMRRRAMEQPFDWGRSASLYEGLYRDAYRARRGHPFFG